MPDDLFERISQMPLVAVLRGITPTDAVAVADALVGAGFCFMEVTLNSPDWQQSLRLINEAHGDNIVLGAGTVLSPDDVDEVRSAGGRVIISPNMDVDVIARTKQLDMLSVPGCCTPTECFQALYAGADILKIFPADTLGVPFIKAVTAVLPANTRLCPTGGVSADNLGDYFAAGVFAAGMGSSLYKAGKSPAEIAKSAGEIVSAFRNRLEL